MADDGSIWLAYSGAALALAAGLALLIWGWRWDRARGRFRCRKCWYDMATQVEANRLVCPECGRRYARVGKLRKTRRNRWMLLTAVLLLMSAGVLAAAPTIQRDGWTKHAPTTVLLLFIPTIDGNKNDVAVELAKRFDLEPQYDARGSVKLDLWNWQRRVAVSQCTPCLDASANPGARQLAVRILTRLGPDAAPAIDSLAGLLNTLSGYEQYSVTRAIEAIGPVGRRCAPALIRLLESNTADDWLNSPIIRALGHYGADSRAAVPTLTGFLTLQVNDRQRWEDGGFTEAIRTLGKIGPDSEPALPSLLQIVRGDPTQPRPDAVAALWRIAPDRPAVRQTLLDALMDSEMHLRQTAARLVQEDNVLLDEALRRLTALLIDTDATVRVRAARGLMSLGPAAAPALAELCGALRDDHAVVRLMAVHAIASIGPAAHPAADDLAALFDDPDTIVRDEARRSHSQLTASGD